MTRELALSAIAVLLSVMSVGALLEAAASTLVVSVKSIAPEPAF